MNADRVPRGLAASEQGAAAEWLTARLRPWPTRDDRVEVGSIVPEGFGAYAAIRHETGNEDGLSDQEAGALAAVLAEFTAAADSCWFCIWAGYGGMRPSGTGHAVVRTPGREYLLFQGPLAAVTTSAHGCPQIWWPSDRAWCVGGDMDLARTFVGGSDECIAALGDRAGLDTERVTLDVTVDETNHLARLTGPR